MLAGTEAYYRQQATELVSAFRKQYGPQLTAARASNSAAARDPAQSLSSDALQQVLPLRWTQRRSPRPFGKVLPGEVARCADVARHHGILLDPIWTLSSWEAAQEAAQSGNSRVVMLMTGGGLGLHGIAQRRADEF